jgi:hypothetical protein
MKILLLILAISNFTISDFDKVEKSIRGVETFAQLVRLIEERIGYEDLDGNKISFTIERDLGNGFQQIRFGFITKRNGRYFHLSLVKQGEQLVYCELEQDRNSSKIIFRELSIREYLSFFNDKFGTSKRVEDFQDEIDGIWMFTTGCGYEGKPSKEWILVEVKNWTN